MNEPVNVCLEVASNVPSSIDGPLIELISVVEQFVVTPSHSLLLTKVKLEDELKPVGYVDDSIVSKCAAILFSSTGTPDRISGFFHVRNNRHRLLFILFLIPK